MRKIIFGAITGLSLWVSLAIPAWGTIYYTSNEASHGYVVGNNANNCTAAATPCLTIDAAALKCAAGGADSVYINASATPYSENSGGQNWLDTRACGTITGDPTLCGSTVTPVTVPTLQAAAATRIINLPSQAFTQTIACFTLDAQLAAGRVGVEPFADNALVLQQVNFINHATFLIGAFGGTTNSAILDRVTADSSNTATGLWNWVASTIVQTVWVKGGAFSAAPATFPTFYWTGTLTNLFFDADVNGTKPTFTGTGAALSGRQIMCNACTITNFRASVVMTGTGSGIYFSVGTVTNWVIDSSTFTGQTAAIPFQLTGTTNTSGVFSNNSGSGALGLALAISEFGQGFSSFNNNFTPSAGSNITTYFYAMGTSYTSTNDGVNSPVNGPTLLGLGGAAQGLSTDAANASARTAGQNLGDLIANTFVAQSWTSAALSSTTRATHIANIWLYLRKSGTPTDNVIVKVYDNNAGVPGSLLGTATTTIGGASLTTATQLFQFIFDTPIAFSPATIYWFRIERSGAIDALNYFILDVNAQVFGTTKLSVDGAVWGLNTATPLRTQIGSGYYAQTAIWDLFRANFTDTAEAREVVGVKSGPNNGTTIRRMICRNCGIGIYFIYANGANYAYDNFIDSNTSVWGGILQKASSGVSMINNTILLRGTNPGPGLSTGPDTTSAINKRGAVNFTAKNNIVKSVATAVPYILSSFTTGTITIDYNDINAAGTVIDIIGSDTWATWQGAGYDLHSIQTDPKLRNPSTPSNFSDIFLMSGSPVAKAGIGIGSPVTVDAVGRTFNSTTPSIGAIQYQNTCSRRAGRLLCQ